MQNREQISQSLANAYIQLFENTDANQDAVIDSFFEVYDNYDFSEKYYKPKLALQSRLQDYKALVEGRNKEDDPEQIMEEIALLAFLSLTTKVKPQSYQSYDAQHDLVISGIGNLWGPILKKIGVPDSSIVLVEAKNTDRPVNVEQFTHLCSVVQNKFDTTCKLGIFFSHSGASGFPPRQSKHRQYALKHAWAKQIIFHARTRKFVVVLDYQDILSLSEPGSLINLLKYKVQEVEKATGLDAFELDAFKKTSANSGDAVPLLPEHLRRHIED